MFSKHVGLICLVVVGEEGHMKRRGKENIEI